MSHFCKQNCRNIEHWMDLERRVHRLIGGASRPENIEDTLKRMCDALEAERKK